MAVTHFLLCTVAVSFMWIPRGVFAVGITSQEWVTKETDATITCFNVQNGNLNELQWRKSSKSITDVQNAEIILDTDLTGSNLVYSNEIDPDHYGIEVSSDGGTYTFTVKAVTLDDIAKYWCRFFQIPAVEVDEIAHNVVDVIVPATTDTMNITYDGNNYMDGASVVLESGVEMVLLTCTVPGVRPSAGITWSVSSSITLMPGAPTCVPNGDDDRLSDCQRNVTFDISSVSTNVTLTCAANICQDGSSDADAAISITLFVAVETRWPQGVYGLTMPTSGCPTESGFDWETGSRFHDTEDNDSNNNWSEGMHLKGPYEKNNMWQHFCMKTVDRVGDNDAVWPNGEYCVFKFGENCPSGMSSGSIFWDDEDDNNRNSVNGTVPSGVYDHNTLINYCCMTNNGIASDPITLPSHSPFYLFAYTAQCQEVQGMNVTREWFKWDDEDDSPRAGYIDGSHPYDTWNGYNHRLYYCYYNQM